MPYTNNNCTSVGAYDQPFSHVGVEYFPLGVTPDRSGITLHEAGFVPDNTDWNWPCMFSPFWRLYYNGLRGHCVVFGERIVELTPDHIVLIPDHCLFHILGENPVPHFWIQFSFVNKLHQDVESPVLLTPYNRELSLIGELQTLIQNDRTREPTDTVYHYGLALLLMVLARPELRWKPAVPDNFAQALKYIAEHVGDDLTNPVLAQRAGMSLASLNRAFRTHMDTTPSVYVMEIRVREACSLLLNSDKGIEEIADDTRFSDRAYFSRVFKRVTGESPAEFRRKHTRRTQ